MQKTSFMIKGFRAFTEKDGDDKTAALLSKLGITSATLEKLKKGEATIEEVATEYEQKIESTVTARIQKTVEEASKKEIFKGVYSKVEKQLANALNLTLAQYAEIEDEKRIGKMLSDAKVATETKLKEIESRFSGDRVEELKKLEAKTQVQLDAANKEKQEALEKAANAERLAGEQIYKIKSEIALSDSKTKFFGAIKNAALTVEQMQAILKAKMIEDGISIDIDDEQGRTFIKDKEGKRMKSAVSVSENMLLDEYLKSVSEKYGFEKKSNGNGNGGSLTVNTDPTQNKEFEHVHPNALEALNKLKNKTN